MLRPCRCSSALPQRSASPGSRPLATLSRQAGEGLHGFIAAPLGNSRHCYPKADGALVSSGSPDVRSIPSYSSASGSSMPISVITIHEPVITTPSLAGSSPSTRSTAIHSLQCHCIATCIPAPIPSIILIPRDSNSTSWNSASVALLSVALRRSVP